MTEEKNSNENAPCPQCSPGGGSKLKMVIFFIVLLLATAIAAHSIIENNKIAASAEESNLSADNASVVVEDVNEADDSPKIDPALCGPRKATGCCPK